MIKKNNSEILIIGGTGSLGKTITKILLSKYKPKGIRIFSRDELKQWELKQDLAGYGGNVSFLLGDVRDRKRLKRAMQGVDIVYNTAAMKQVPACEYNPLEAVKTNIIGAVNVIDCALDNDVKIVMHVSTDKAVYPINLYGATKTVAEKLFLNANIYNKGGKGTKFSCVRYGNVLGSRGSIIPLFKKQMAETGSITITDKGMTRFWIGLKTVAEFIIESAERTKGNEIYIPKMRTAKVVDLAKIIAPDAKIIQVGIRKGEKLHETLITYEESRHTYKQTEYFIVNENEEYFGNPWTYTSNMSEYEMTRKELINILREEEFI